MPFGLQPKPSDEDVSRELIRHRGRLTLTAKALGVNSVYVRKRIQDNPEVQAAYRHSRDEFVDTAEDVMYSRLKDGSESAAKFVLATLGKDRGYTERTEVVGKGGGSIQVTLNLGRKPINFDEEVEEIEVYDYEELTSPDDLLEYEEDE